MQGGCLCGQIRYEITGPARSVVACHCSQCRKTSGHYVAATRVPLASLTVLDGGTGVGGSLRWYRSSQTATRAFCGTCGSQLFWQRDGSDHRSVMAGTLDTPCGLVMDRQIFCEDKGDYYALPDVPAG